MAGKDVQNQAQKPPPHQVLPRAKGDSSAAVTKKSDVSTFILRSDEFYKSELSCEEECFEVYVNGLQTQSTGPSCWLKLVQEQASIFKKYFKCEGVHLKWIL